MKKLLVAITLTALAACGGKQEKSAETAETPAVAEGAAANLTPEEQAGQEIFDGKGNCYTCHKPDAWAVGPSIKDIAKIYKEQKADMVTFLKGNGKPIVKPEQYEVMKTNFYLTKTFTDAELKSIQAYMYSVQ